MATETKEKSGVAKGPRRTTEAVSDTRNRRKG